MKAASANCSWKIMGNSLNCRQNVLITGYVVKLSAFLVMMLTGCASRPPVIVIETPAPVTIEVEEEQVEAIEQEPEVEMRSSLGATLVYDGILRSSYEAPYYYVTRVPGRSQVRVSGYEENQRHNGYLRVTYEGKTGYLSLANFQMTDELKHFIAEEKQKIYIHNMETLSHIETMQENLESKKALVITSQAEIRASGSADSPVIDKLKKGDMFFIQEERADWYLVLYNRPVIDYESSEYSAVAEIVSRYKDRDSLLSEYHEGWIHDRFTNARKVDKYSDQEKRRSFFIQQNPNIPELMKNAILNGEIIIGMTADMVEASWGTADEIESSDTLFDSQEQWIYDDTYLFFDKGRLNGWQNFDE